MIDDLVARLHALDRARLTEVVRQDQGDPAFELRDWSIRRLSDHGVIDPDGLWLVTGRGQGAGSIRPWSVVVKLFARPDQEAPPESRFYWKRELLVAQSTLLDRRAGGVRPPHVYGTDEDDDGAWLWMEHLVDDRAGAWTLDDYARAARHLGRWNGAGTAQPLPSEPWLNARPHRGWHGGVNPETDWQSPLHQKYQSHDIRRRWEQLWAERERFYHVLETVAQGFVHFDCQRRNLFLQRGQDAQEELVAIDWALCGVGALGSELQALVGGSSTFVEWPPTAIAALDRTAFAGYVHGLHEVGWSGEVDAVRLAHVACLAIYRGAPMPGAMGWACAPESRPFALRVFGMAEEALYAYLRPLLAYWLACADEARVLMQRLGIG